jgi:hypothetical protein
VSRAQPDDHAPIGLAIERARLAADNNDRVIDGPLSGDKDDHAPRMPIHPIDGDWPDDEEKR